MATRTRSEVLDDMAAVSEQLLKTTEAASRQAQETMGAAQEQFQQSLTRTQQAQSEAARAMFRWNEQSSLLGTAAIASFWDASLSMLRMTTWAQEQAERTLLQLMEQGKVTRDEGATLLRDGAEQARRHQTELYRLAQESLRVGLFYAGKTARREGEAAR